jgi:chaperone modulatory protein CbpM
MISIQEFITRVRVDRELVQSWVLEGWLLPNPGTGDGFSELDVARGCLIRDLKMDFGVNDEGITLILHLLDQMHGLRRSFEQLAKELRHQRLSRNSGAIK